MENVAHTFRETLGIPKETRVASLAPLFGLAIVHAWIFAFNTAGGIAPQELAPWQFVYLPIAATMLAIAAASRKVPDFITRKGVCVVVAAAGIVAAVLPLIPLGSTAESYGAIKDAASLALGGIFIGWCYSQWAVSYARFTMAQATFFLFGSGIVAACLKTALFFFGYAPSHIALAVLAPVAILAGARNGTELWHRPHASLRFTRKDARSLWKVAALIIVFSLVNANLLANDQLHASQTPLATFLLARACEIALCACVLAWTFALKKPFDFVQLWRIILVILATDILLRIAFPDAWLQPIFSSICVNFIVLFVWLTLCDIAQHTDMHPTTVFGIGWSLYTVPLFIGVTFAQLSNGHTAETLFLAVMLYAALIVSTFCLELRDRDMQFIFSDINAAPAPTPQEFADIDARCKAIAKQKHLTARELEVMQMLCKGRTKAYIAESMFVTENTVKGHTKRLYTKLGVHSKKELQQLIDLQ